MAHALLCDEKKATNERNGSERIVKQECELHACEHVEAVDCLHAVIEVLRQVRDGAHQQLFDKHLALADGHSSGAVASLHSGLLAITKGIKEKIRLLFKCCGCWMG